VIIVRRALLLLLSVSALSAAAVAATEESHLMRYADVHLDRIVFTFEDDLWLVPTTGGDARRITTHPGAERYARFSPDGSKIAFTAEYDGGRDVYVMDSGGGVPVRMTWHPARDRVLGWSPDGASILFRSRREHPMRAEQVYLVSVRGGMPRRLPVPRAGLASLSPDGARIAYNRISREDRPWKRYRGGMAQDLWIGTLGERDFRRVTEWDGTDNYPMWIGDAVYFTSDREHGTLNLYRYDTASEEVLALTDYRDYDVRYPSDGPGMIVYQYAETLHLLDVDSGESRKVPVRVPSDRVPVRTEFRSATGHVGTFRLSPDGEDLLLESRGEILSIPVEDGEAVNLTRASGTREKNAVWSPDGERVAFLSDATGEEEIYLTDPDGKGEWRQLTSAGGGFRNQPVWSPDSRFLLYSDKHMRLNLVDAETGEIQVIDSTPWDEGWYRWGIQDYVWSPCSRWIAYTKLESSLYESIFLYSLDSGETTRVTQDVTSDWSPSFDPEGRYLYFLSNRTFRPIMGQVDQNHVFLDMTLPYVVILRDGERSPFAPDPPEGTGGSEEDAGEDDVGEDDAGEDDEGEKEDPTTIDLVGIRERIVPAADVKSGSYFRLEATSSGFLYLAATDLDFLKYQEVTDVTGRRLDLYAYDLDGESAEKILAGINNYHLSADGKKTVYRAGGKYGVVGTGKKAKPGDGDVALDKVRIRVNKLEEYLQIFNEAWRVQRDWFYDPGLHGVDWEKIGDKYRRFVPSCGNRADLNYLIREMISELNIGHTYIGGGEFGRRDWAVSVGLLGAEFERPEGAGYYRIAHIVPGNNWNPRERSPLEEPGCEIRSGDWLLAMDGQEVQATDNVYRFLEDKVDRYVTVEFNDEPTREGSKTCHVKPIRSEGAIRYREWVEANRARVDEMSGGAIGYLHLPDMMQPGLIEFARAYYPRFRSKAFVIDDRYNAGGFTGDMIVDRLERRIWAMTKPREGDPIPNPERTFRGHLAVLINEETGSNGEYFAQAIKLRNLAILIGMRTWGGAVGIEPHQGLMDGAVTTPPQFAPYGLDRTWLIEGTGVEPDVEVQNLPGEVLDGKDSQLEYAVRHLLDKITSDPLDIPPPPDFPDKSKPGEEAAR
jgi:tricorn protease